MNTPTSTPRFRAPPTENPVAHWGPNAPKGARAVLGRIVKEGANVPLFLGQTLVNALRDLGYNDTTSAICEHVDNAVQWNATEIRVYFHETGRRGSERRIDVLVYDNGVGMAPNVLRAVTAFGGSMCYDNRSGIGRYGMGMKAAALSISPTLEIHSWQERSAFYSMVLDVNDIANDQKNVVSLPEPEFSDAVSAEIRQIMSRPMAYPKDADSQDLFCDNADGVPERLGQSGTIIYMPVADRLTYRQAKTLVDHATKDMSRIYRRQLAAGLRLYVNNRRVLPFDPTYWMPEARHTAVEGLGETRSRITNRWTIEIPEAEDDERGSKHEVRVALFMLPIESWHEQPRKVLKNDLHVFDPSGVSFMRSDREVQMKPLADLTGRSAVDHWWRLEVEFPPELDEAFGVSVNKQGVRPKGYVLERLRNAIAEDLTSVRRHIVRFQANRAAQHRRGPSTAELKASETDGLQAHPLPQPDASTEEQRRELEARLRELAIAHRREDESEEEALERVRASKYLMAFRHDEGPFYSAEFQLGKVVLSLNTAHPFFAQLYQPLAEMAKLSEGSAGEEVTITSEQAATCAHLSVRLQLFLLALARTQSEVATTDEDQRKLFVRVRRRWSDALDTMLSAP